MSKKFFFRLLMILGALVAGILWLLSVVIPDTFGWFNLSYAIAIITGVGGISFILLGVFEKSNVLVKKLNIFFGAGLIIVMIFALVSAIKFPTNWVLPIVAIVLVVALLIGLVVTGGKKWDEGDNQKVGYKNYEQRKAEEEKRKEKEQGEDK